MKILAIFGAGGQGCEALDIARTINEVSPTWDDFIFINNGDKADDIDGVKVMGLEEALKLYKGQMEANIAVGEPTLRNKIAAELKMYDIPGANLISPGVRIPPLTRIGTGITIFPGVYISSNCVIGNHIIISPNVVIGHDVTIEDQVILGSNCVISGMVHIKEAAYIGPQSVIKESINIGSSAIVALGSAVFKDIEDGDVCVGNPARVSKRSSERIF